MRWKYPLGISCPSIVHYLQRLNNNHAYTANSSCVFAITGSTADERRNLADAQIVHEATSHLVTQLNLYVDYATFQDITSPHGLT